MGRFLRVSSAVRCIMSVGQGGVLSCADAICSNNFVRHFLRTYSARLGNERPGLIQSKLDTPHFDSSALTLCHDLEITRPT